MDRFTQRPLGAHSRLQELKASPLRAVRGVDRTSMSLGEDRSKILVRGGDDGVDEPE